MADREKVIKGLEICIKNNSFAMCVSSNCPFIGGAKEGNCIDMLMRDALALLKAQEPRVMTLEEALGAEVNVDQCWLEVKGIKQIYLADAVACPEHTERADIQRWGASDCQLPLDLYGAYWRMWDRKPTKEQREAVKWDD